MPPPRPSASPRRKDLSCCARVQKVPGARFLRHLDGNRFFNGTLAVALVFALFGGSIWVLFDLPDESSNVWLDTSMCLVTGMFIVEMLVRSLASPKEYPFSFFFWADLVGTASMCFEVSFLFGSAGKENSAGGAGTDTVMLRTARATKVGARAGRFAKIMKCLSMVYGKKMDGKKGAVEDTNDKAKILSRQLLLKLSTKVSLLTIILIVCVPLFSLSKYPEADYSMEAWVNRLKDEYERAYDYLEATPTAKSTNIFQTVLVRMETFYLQTSSGDQTRNYFPFALAGFASSLTIAGRSVSIPGVLVVETAIPNRRYNVISVVESVCRHGACHEVLVSFDFKKPNQLEQGMDIAMICFIVLVMVVMSFDLSQSIDRLILKPLEKILGLVRTTASKIQMQVDQMDASASVQMFDEKDKETETELLERVFQKLVRLADVSMGKNVVSEDQLQAMDSDCKGIIVDMMQMPVSDQRYGLGPSASAQSDGGAHITLGKLPVDKSVIESWDLDLLSLEPAGQLIVIHYIFFDSQVGKATGRANGDIATFNNFHDQVKAGYSENPYHNYTHACDVFYTVFRLLTETQGGRWLTDVEQMAILIAALAHDLGHFGQTNPFLVDTKHEIALRYNDKSPLENMHCAKLFEICQLEARDVFKKLKADDYKRSRKVCIESILHTDNALHFEMVKDISKAYEMSQEICDNQAADQALDPAYVHNDYETQVLRKEPLLWLQLFLHLADVSNPLKPFKICQAWAIRVLEEFFAQGDEEKRLSIPIGMLNDRTKINRPGSQHGFINFLVAPLVFGAVSLFPVLHCLCASMADNLHQWRDLWVEDAKPGQDDIDKKDADIAKIRGTVEEKRRKHIRPSQGGLSRA